MNGLRAPRRVLLLLAATATARGAEAPRLVSANATAPRHVNVTLDGVEGVEALKKAMARASSVTALCGAGGAARAERAADVALRLFMDWRWDPESAFAEPCAVVLRRQPPRRCAWLRGRHS